MPFLRDLLLGAYLAALLALLTGCGSREKELELSGDEALQQGNDAQALAFFTEAIAESASPVRLYAKRARVFRSQGKLDEALADFDRAVEGSTNPDLRLERAAVALQARLADRAIADFEYVIEREPKHAAAHAGRGEALLIEGKYAEAIDALSRAIELAPGQEKSHIFRGMAYARSEQPKLAEADFSKAIELNPRNGQAYWRRARARQQLGSRALAERDRAKAIELEPALGLSDSTMGESLLKELGGKNDFGALPVGAKID